MDFASISIPDPRPLYPEHIATSAPLGTRERLRRAAQQAGTSTAALIRDAIEARLRQVSATTATEA